MISSCVKKPWKAQNHDLARELYNNIMGLMKTVFSSQARIHHWATHNLRCSSHASLDVTPLGLQIIQEEAICNCNEHTRSL